MNVHDAPSSGLSAHDDRPSRKLARSADEKRNHRDVSVELQVQIERNERRWERRLRSTGWPMGVGKTSTKDRFDGITAGALGREGPVEEHRDVVGECRAERVEVARIERREIVVKKCAEIARTIANRSAHNERDVFGARYSGTRRTQ